MGALEVVEVSCQPGSEGAPQLLGCATPMALVSHRVDAGGSYALRSDDFHIAHSVGHTITQVIRGPVIHQNARVLRPLGSNFVCPFSIDKTTEECWTKIAQMLG